MAARRYAEQLDWAIIARRLANVYAPLVGRAPRPADESATLPLVDMNF